MGIKFSVIIPAYNAEKSIIETLDSVYSQTYRNFEVIIVNDGSKDHTEKKVMEYISLHRDIKIKYIWQENEGVASARYRCGLEAEGEYLAFLDADDVWHAQKLEYVSAAAKKTHADVIYHDIIEVAKSGKRKKLKSRVLQKDACADLIIHGNALSTSATCASARIYRECDPFADKNSAYEDYECWIRFAKKGASFYHINKYLSEYRRNDDSLTMANDKYIIDSYYNSIQFVDKYLDKKKYTKKELKKIKHRKKAMCDYELGRSYHQQGRYKEARKMYAVLLRSAELFPKTAVLFILALLKIRY